MIGQVVIGFTILLFVVFPMIFDLLASILGHWGAFLVIMLIIFFSSIEAKRTN